RPTPGPSSCGPMTRRAQRSAARAWSSTRPSPPLVTSTSSSTAAPRCSPPAPSGCADEGLGQDSPLLQLGGRLEPEELIGPLTHRLLQIPRPPGLEADLAHALEPWPRTLHQRAQHFPGGRGADPVALTE